MKKIILTAAAMVLALLLGIRIWSVNQGVEVPKIRQFEPGDTVELGRDFFEEEYEICEGYTVRVNGGRLMTYEKFLEAYGIEEDPDAPFVPKDSLTFPNLVYDLDVTFRNNNTEDKDMGIDLFNYQIIATDYLLQVEPGLYAAANADSKNQELNFRLRPGTEMNFHLPYGIATETALNSLNMDVLIKREWNLLVSRYPVQKQIRVHQAGERFADR